MSRTADFTTIRCVNETNLIVLCDHGFKIQTCQNHTSCLKNFSVVAPSFEAYAFKAMSTRHGLASMLKNLRRTDRRSSVHSDLVRLRNVLETKETSKFGSANELELGSAKFRTERLNNFKFWPIFRTFQDPLLRSSQRRDCSGNRKFFRLALGRTRLFPDLK